jgi:hypothetical protein
MQRLSGRDVDVTLPSGRIARVDQVNLELTIGTKAVRSGGYPAGWVYGEISGNGEMVMDTEDMLLILDDADTAGSWEEMDEIDINFYAAWGVDGDTLTIVAHGCKLDAPDFKIDRKGGEKVSHTIKFEITGPDFVTINGVRVARLLQ